MLLTVDAGNTNICLSVYKGDEMLYAARIGLLPNPGEDFRNYNGGDAGNNVEER